MLSRPFARRTSSLSSPSSLSMLPLLALSTFAVTVAGCGPAAPVAETPGVAIAAPPSSVASVAEPPADVPPAPEPDGLQGVLRIGSPVRDLVMWRDLLPAHTALGQLMSLGPEGLAALVFGSLGEQIDLDAPVDAVFLEGSPSTIVASLALRDLEAAKRTTAADFTFTQAPDGSIAVKPRARAKDAGFLAKFEFSCAIHRVPPANGHRLVCSADPDALELATPYLVRTVARQPAAEGIRYDLPESALAAILEERKGSMETTVSDEADNASKAGERMGAQLAEQFTADFANLALDLAASPSGVVLGSDLRFRSASSPFTLALVGNRGAAPPAAFWKIPSDADFSFFFPGAAPDAMRAASSPFWTAFESIAEPEERDSFNKFTTKLRELLFTGGPSVFAHGPAAPAKPSPTAKPAPEPKTPAERAKRHAARRTALSGWTLVTVPEPATRWTDGLRELMKIDAEADKQRAARRSKPTSAGTGTGAGTGADATPKKNKKKLPERGIDRTTIVAIRASEGLPTGSLHLLRRETPNPAYKPEAGKSEPLDAPWDMHVFVAGTADNTWLTFSENESLARAKLIEAMSSTAGGIGARADLSTLRALPAGGAGFFTLRAIMDMLSDAGTAKELAQSEGVLQQFASLPSLGASPIFVSLTSRPATDATTTVRISTTLSIAAFVDFVQWMQMRE